MALDDAERLREEDPFTGQAVRRRADAHRRPSLAVRVRPQPRRRQRRLSRPPSNAGGWRCGSGGRPTRSLVERSLAIHAEYYRMLAALLDGVAARHARFVLIDVHSYNHRRDGPDARADAAGARRPTSTSAPSRCRATQWAFLVDPLIEAMARVRLQRPPARRARECRLPGQGRADPLRPRALPGPRLRDRARVQEILHGRMDRRARPRRARRDAALRHAHRRTAPRSCWRE